MRASELIRAAAGREWGRLESWAGEHVPPAVARDAVASAFGDSYFRAAGWWRTADGPHAMLLGSTDAAMRLTTFGRHYFIPKNARVTCTLPDLGELLELAQAYAWLGAAARQLDLEYGEESLVWAAIQAHGRLDPIERMVCSRRLEPARGREMVGRLLDAADRLSAAEPAPGSQTEAVARREYERGRRWLQRAAAMRGTRVGSGT